MLYGKRSCTYSNCVPGEVNGAACQAQLSRAMQSKGLALMLRLAPLLLSLHPDSGLLARWSVKVEMYEKGGLNQELQNNV